MLQLIKNWLLDKSLFIAIILSLVVIMLSLINTQALPTTQIKLSDKALHGIAYMVLMWSWLFHFREHKLRKTKWFIFLALALLGIVLEVIQGSSLLMRTMDWKDSIANIVGLSLGLLTFKPLFRILFRK